MYDSTPTTTPATTPSPTGGGSVDSGGASTSTTSWTVSFGGCTFTGDYAGAPLVRTGSCPARPDTLDLSSKGITSVQPDAFQGLSKMT